jgi:hypothetical protein
MDDERTQSPEKSQVGPTLLFLAGIVVGVFALVIGWLMAAAADCEGSTGDSTSGLCSCPGLVNAIEVTLVAVAAIAPFAGMVIALRSGRYSQFLKGIAVSVAVLVLLYVLTGTTDQQSTLS